MLDLNFAFSILIGGLLIMGLVIISRGRGDKDKDDTDKNEPLKKALDAFLKLVRLLKG